MVIQSGTTEHSAFVIRMDNKGVFLYKPYQKKRGKIMSGILMMVIAIVVLGGAYLLYGRYLQNKWGIDQKQKHRHMKWKMEWIMYRQIPM